MYGMVYNRKREHITARDIFMYDSIPVTICSKGGEAMPTHYTNCSANDYIADKNRMVGINIWRIIKYISFDLPNQILVMNLI